MDQKDRLPNMGSKTTLFGLLKPILSHNSQLLKDKLPLASDFAYIASHYCPRKSVNILANHHSLNSLTIV